MLDHRYSEGGLFLHCMDAWFLFVPVPLFNSLSETVMGYLAPLAGSIDSAAVAAAMIGKAAEYYSRVLDALTSYRIKSSC